ncbi:MAG TPA: N-acetylglucosamine-6-phosphate deacetylase [Steroidobacteraceae bacterium]|jgi:N-acetylglucosamine-6-phosphate deacetylase
MTASDCVLVGARVVLPGEILDPGWVHVRGDAIVAVGSGTPPLARHVDLEGAWLLPGYVDLHMHGGGGYDVAASSESMIEAVAFHRAHGTTATLVSLVTAPLDVLVEQLGWAAALTERGPTARGTVLGAHLEGPFLSHARCGAQNAAYLRDPDPTELQTMLTAARGTLRTVTVAPELPGAVELVAQLVAAGVVAALGHSDATFDQGRAAIAAGATLATHLFNGMRPLHHREPGLVGATLSGGIAFELINDGVHLHPAMTAVLSAPGRHPVLVTDAIDAAGVGDGEFVLGGQLVDVRDGEARLRSSGSLAGSTLTMELAVRRAVLDSGLTIEAASAAASGNPAAVLGLHNELGSIAAGMRADLVVLNDEFWVTQVMSSGEWCDQSATPAENGIRPNRNLV